MAAVHFDGSNNPLGISSTSDKISFFPYFFIKDTLGLVAFLIFFSYFIYFSPNYLGHTDEGPRGRGAKAFLLPVLGAGRCPIGSGAVGAAKRFCFCTKQNHMDAFRDLCVFLKSVPRRPHMGPMGPLVWFK